MKKADLLKDTVNISIANNLKVGKAVAVKAPSQGGKQTPASMSSIICDLLSQHQKKEGAQPFAETLDQAKEDQFSGVKEKLSGAALDRNCMDGVLRTAKIDPKTVSLFTLPLHKPSPITPLLFSDPIRLAESRQVLLSGHGHSSSIVNFLLVLENQEDADHDGERAR